MSHDRSADPPGNQEFMDRASAAVDRGYVTWAQLSCLLSFGEPETQILASILDSGWAGTVAALIETVEHLAGGGSGWHRATEP